MPLFLLVFQSLVVAECYCIPLILTMRPCIPSILYLTLLLPFGGGKPLLLPMPGSGLHWNALSLSTGFLRKFSILDSKHFARLFWKMFEGTCSLCSQILRFPWGFKGLPLPALGLLIGTGAHCQGFPIIHSFFLCDLPPSPFIQEIVDSVWWYITVTLQQDFKNSLFIPWSSPSEIQKPRTWLSVACILLCHSLLDIVY